MTTTNFTTGTVIESTWLNDVDAVVYGDGSSSGSMDANNVKYTPTGTGAVATTVGTKLHEQVSVRDFGAVGDGVTDDTAAIQAAINIGGRIYFQPGTYLVTQTIACGSNTQIEFSAAVYVNLVPLTSNETTNLFSIANQSNVTINGNGAIFTGYRSGANPSIEGTAACFFIYGSDNVRVRDCNIYNFSTDGITVTGDNTGSGPCRNISIENCVCSNNRRQGLSIISVIGMTVIGGKYELSNGAPSGPWSGIDIEPNSNCQIDGVNIIGVETSANKGSGILCVPGALPTGSTYNVSIVGHTSNGDNTDGRIDYAGFLCANGNDYVSSAKIYGSINYIDGVISNPGAEGVFFNAWAAAYMPHVNINNLTVINPCTIASASDPTTCGVAIYPSSFISNAVSRNYGNISIRGVRVLDNRATAVANAAIYIESAGGAGTITNVYIEDAFSDRSLSGYTGVKIGWNTNLSFANTTINNIANPVSLGAADVLYRYMGSPITMSASGKVISLPPAAYFTGMTFTISNASGVNTTTLRPYAGDNLGFVNLYNASGDLILDEYCNITVLSVGGTSWEVVSISGQYRPLGGALVRRGALVYKTTAPTTGTFAVGDICKNSAPSVGQPKGWVCTVAGTPGTWVSEGNL